MKGIEKIDSNSAFWPFLDAVGIYSWSSGCLPINSDFGDFDVLEKYFDFLAQDFGVLGQVFFDLGISG